MNLAAQILSERNLLDYLPRDVRLIATGHDAYRTKCPFTDGDGLSFAIRRHARGHLVFKCFSCGEGGTVIDLYAKLNNVSVREAIVVLASGIAPISTDAELMRAFDRFAASHGYAVLACDAPKCMATKEVKTELDAAVIMANGSPWEVAPDGIGALCPRHG